MTADVLLDVPTRRRAFPQIFNRLVLILIVQAHLFALIGIAGSASEYRSLPVCLVLWVVSLSVPLACLAVARRTAGALPAGVLLAACGVLVAVDLVLPAVVPGRDYGGAAMWNWGAIGVTILGFAALRPARDVLLIAAGHSLLAVAVTATALHRGSVDAFDVLIVANAAATPALAAARYLNLYIQAVQLREQAAADRRQIQTRQAAAEAIEKDAAARLRSVRADVVPLLAGVADGTVAVDDPQVAALARRLAADLRRELVAARSGRWLLPAGPGAPGAAATGAAEAASPAASVDLLDPSRLLGRLRDADRGALTALLGILHGCADWQRLSVALAPADGGGHPASLAGDRDVSAAAVTVVATGAGARAACQDPAAAVAARTLSARLHLEAPDVLVAETSLTLRPPALPAGHRDG